MPSTNDHSQYDTALLASAPVTKQQLQEGYRTDILHQPTRPKFEPQRDLEAAAPAPAPYRQESFPEKPLPFWRTTKGIIIISVAAVVVLGAVIGGAVGGTVSKKSKGGDKQFIAPSAAAGDTQGAGSGQQSNALGNFSSIIASVNGSPASAEAGQITPAPGPSPAPGGPNDQPNPFTRSI